MKSFLISLIFFVIVLSGIFFYQYAIGKKAEEINLITVEIQKSVDASDEEKFNETTKKLSDSFEDVKNWLMAFEDHEQILEMAQCIQELKAYKNDINDPAVLIGLNKFKYLLNYSVESVKPTMENIF